MYSQDAIFSRRGRRTEPTEEMLSGLVCVVCRTDYRSRPTADPDPVVVSHSDDRQLLACQGVCARMTSGSATGLDEMPPPLSERMRRHNGDAS
jgi:hypothetical protein